MTTSMIHSFDLGAHKLMLILCKECEFYLIGLKTEREINEDEKNWKIGDQFGDKKASMLISTLFVGHFYELAQLKLTSAHS